MAWFILVRVLFVLAVTLRSDPDPAVQRRRWR